METVQCPSGVDVSWTHHQGDKAHSKAPPPRAKATSPSAPLPATLPDSTTPRSAPENNATPILQQPQPPPSKAIPSAAIPINGSSIPPSDSPAQPLPSPSAPASTSLKAESKRSGLSRNKPSSERLSQSPETSSKRPGWISSLSQKFGSSSQPSLHNANGQIPNAQQVGAAPAPSSAGYTTQQVSSPTSPEAAEELKPYVPQQPKSGNFFSNTLRRLSTSSGAGPYVKAPANGGVCPRQTLNVDHGRDRCELNALRPSRLKRVAFSVDVEIAGSAQYGDDEAQNGPVDKKKDIRMKDKSEGAALKNPTKVAEEKDKLGAVCAVGEQSAATPSTEARPPLDQPSEQQQALVAVEEAARAERAERRRMAGAVPMETNMDDSDDDTATGVAQVQDKPTTDPVRKYRRCCQLREAPVLKRITEQLMNPQRCGLEKDGTVGCLDLRGSRMQLQDVICVGDWLSIVPVRKLLLDNANLSDDGLRHVLAGLLAARPAGSKKRRRGRSNPHQPRKYISTRSLGVIEKLTLKNNPRITSDGWKYILVFLNMCKSIRAIDLSMIPFAVERGASEAANKSAKPSSCKHAGPVDMTEMFYTSLSTRLGKTQLTELTMGNCNLTTRDIGKIVDAALACGISTLGFAQNKLSTDGLEHVLRFVKSNVCMALDIGGNDLRGNIASLADAIEACDPNTPFWGLSLAECNLDPYGLAKLMPAFAKLPTFRFLDLSHNHDLFSKAEERGGATALGTLRKFLPQLTRLRRLHLSDVALAPSHAIALAEIFPEVRNLNHVALTENPQLMVLAKAETTTQQEDACALYASLMTAVRVSKTLLAIEIESPGPVNSDVVRAVHKQMTAYTLRNLERYTTYDAVNEDDPAAILPGLPEEDEHSVLPQVLVHLVGQAVAPGSDSEHEQELGPDHDYLVGGTGVVKALTYCLGQRTADRKRLSMSGASTPVTPKSPAEAHKPWEERAEEKVRAKQMSKDLLESARKIRKRLQAAIERDKNTADDIQWRRLQFLDQTLSGIIERFEQEYPECRVLPSIMSALPQGNASSAAQTEPVEVDPSPSLSRGSSVTSINTGNSSAPNGVVADEDGDFMFSARSSRRGSEASIHSRKMDMEEGQMLLFGQRVRRELLPPRGQTDHLHGTSASDDPEEEHLAMLRSQLEKMAGDQLRDHVVKSGLDATVQEYQGRVNDFKRMSLSRPSTSDAQGPDAS